MQTKELTRICGSLTRGYVYKVYRNFNRTNSKHSYAISQSARHRCMEQLA